MWIWTTVPAPSSQCARSLTELAQSIGAPPLAIVLATNSSKANAHWYNFTIEDSSPCDTIGGLTFEVHSPTGAVVTFPGGAEMDIVAPGGETLSAYNLSGEWAYGPGYGPQSAISSNNLLSLYYEGGSPSTLTGDFLEAFAPWGSLSAPI